MYIRFRRYSLNCKLGNHKYERLFNSVKCSEDEHNLLAINIDLEAESCSSAEICEGNECTHCHVECIVNA